MNVKIGRRIASLIAVAAVIICAVCGVLMNISADDKGFRLTCKTPDGVLREDNHWDMYYIGKTGSGGEKLLIGEFANFSVELDFSSSSALADTARTLETYTRVNKITPTASGNSDKNGILTFGGLDNGIYLFVGQQITEGIKTYIPVSFIAELTDTTAQIDVSPKYTSFLVAAGEDYTYTVKKIWKNGGSRIPLYIDVDIYCDGDLYESVKLSDENDWTYKWDADDFYLWDVVERDVPEGFKVEYSSNEWQYAIVNTLSAQEPGIDFTTSTTTSATGTNIQTETTVFETLVSNTSPVSSENETMNTQTTDTKTPAATEKNVTSYIETVKLPQTGQLWWPVPVLVLVGIIFVAIGLKLWKKD